MRVVLLVPWRSDDGTRERVWAACRRRWEALFPDWPIYEGLSPDGPFNRSAAINDAAKRAGDWDVAVIIDADVMLPEANVREAVRRASATGKVTWAHRRWRSISEDDSERILTRPKSAEGALGPGGIERSDFTEADIDLIVDRTTALSWSCCIAVRRDAWETIGGFDERFVGWGFEDSAFSAAAALVGWDRVVTNAWQSCTDRCPPICSEHAADVLNFWHPRARGAGKADRDSSNRYTQQALYNARLGMRYMVALRRDYGLTDRPDPSPPEVLERDIANLRKQDATFALQQLAAERWEFDDWWPTIEELQAGARQSRVGKSATVTVVVHTGGSPETWPARRDYLRRSLVSLAEQVTGPIVQSVVYDCWGDPLIRDEIQAMLPRDFYVVGPTERPNGYTAARIALWRYIDKRARGTFIYQTEDDFIHERPVQLEPMIEALERDRHLLQVALLRNPYPSEAAKGGILGWPLDKFTAAGQNGDSRLEHRQFWTANPSLFRRSLANTPWPTGKSSETLFGRQLFRDPRAKVAFWGKGEQWITHIGEVRAGTGY